MARMLAVIATIATALACGRGPEQSRDVLGPAALQPSAVEQIKAILAEKDGRSAVQRKISSQLLYARNGLPTRAGAQKLPPLESLTPQDELGRVLIDVKGDLPQDAAARVALLGGAIVSRSVAHGSMRAWLDLSRLEDLAAFPGVRAIRPALQATTSRADVAETYGYEIKQPRMTRAQRVEATARAVRQRAFAPRPALAEAEAGPVVNAGAAQSQGSKAHAAERARKWFNVDGTGVKVGVLSDSDDFKEASIASGDLPADTVTVPGQSGRPGSGEGTAMMEIVHDVAPGARLFFASAFDGPEAFADNIRTLRFTYGCDVIVDDVIYFFESPYADDIIAQAVNDVVADGAVYVSSAGNQGNYDDGTSGTWEGDFKNGGTLSTLDGVGYTAVHDWGNGVISNRIEASGGPLILHWSDYGTLDDPRSANDYDLLVLDPDLRNVVVAGTDIQDGNDLPFEFLGFNIPPDYRVVVAKFGAAEDRAFRIVHFGGELGLSTPGATYGHGAAAEAISAAAVDVAEAAGGEFVAGATTPVETFSSDGGRKIFYDSAGNLVNGPPLFRHGRGENRSKPDLTGADGVSTTLPSFSGLNPFFGTSAAAPHIGAIAALVKQGNAVEDGWHVRQAVLNSGMDIEARGEDRDSGMGIVNAFQALRNIGAKPAVFLELASLATAPSSGTAVNPGGGGSVAATLVNNGGALARNVRATLTSSSPYVTITGGTSTYPNLAPGASAANATPLAFAVSSAAPCGARLAFRLGVSFTGRGTSPTVFSFSVQTGRPAAAVTETAYAGAPVAIPDDDAAGVNIPLTLGSVGGLAKVAFKIGGTACSTAIASTTVGIDHTWAGDVVLSLTSPAGTTVRLINQVGGSGNNFCQTVLDDSAATSVQTLTSADAPFTGTFRPASPLSTFNGEPGDGTWVVNVSDNAFLDTGSVRAFSVLTSPFECTP